MHVMMFISSQHFNSWASRPCNFVGDRKVLRDAGRRSQIGAVLLEETGGIDAYARRAVI